MKYFIQSELNKLYKPKEDSSNEDNGKVTIIGGSSLFHGAPLLSLKVASRIVDMVFFASPEPSVGEIAEKIKSKLLSFIWLPWSEVDKYVEKSDAVLIGPGFMRFKSEKTLPKNRVGGFDQTGTLSRQVTKRLLKKFPHKKWVIDAGSLQTMDEVWIPKGAILTPNIKEFEMLFKFKMNNPLRGKNSKLKMTDQNLKFIKDKANEHNCVIVLKGPEAIVCSPSESVIVRGGNAGLTKGGSGDVLAGLTVALLAKNDPFLAASSASYIAKTAAADLYKRVGTNYNADDLADEIPSTYLNHLLTH